MKLFGKKCQYCGKKLAADAFFCSQCGKEQIKTKFINAVPSYTCPFCGATADVFSCTCKYCGKEQIGVVQSKAVLELTAKLEELESKRSNSKIGMLFESASFTKMSKIDEQKINLISTFVVPNSKADLLEFMVLASSNIDGRIKACNNYIEADMQKKEFAVRKATCEAWIAKRNQVYNKARISFGNEDDFLVFEKLMNDKREEIKENAKGFFYRRYGADIFLGAFILMVFVMYILGILLH